MVSFTKFQRRFKRIIPCLLCLCCKLSFSGTYGVLPTVNVTDTYISYWNPTSYDPDYGSEAAAGGVYTGGGNPSLEEAIASSRERAFDLSKVCNSPVSAGAKSTTKNSDVTTRWLAAQEVFNVIQTKNLWNSYGAATQGLSFIMDGVKYRGFKVTYADGSRETWAVNPGYATSTVKLLDQPLPNSLKEGTEPGCITG